MILIVFLVISIVHFSLYRYSVTFRAENGGYRIVSNDVGKQYYVGRTTERKIDLKFDTETPYHCSEKSSVGYISSSSTMMTIQNDDTKVISKLSVRGPCLICEDGFYSLYGMI